MEKLQGIFDRVKKVEYGMQTLILIMEVLQEQFDLQYENKIYAVLEVLIRQMVSLKNDLERELEMMDKILSN